ncbi:MAG: Dabb family protein [Candidatus Egerieousia sp.]|nr:Dabb family protein [bacterium]MDY5256093.1 Dabb family protein [Candidatus Egerieousia sp.]
MVYKHIVMWKFKEQHNGKSALENARWMKEQLEALVGVVPELLSAEVGISPALEQAAAVPSNAAAAAEAPSPVAAQSNAAAAPAPAASGEYDACLVSTFASPEALSAYKVHPKHKAISAYCKEARLKRLAFDWWSEE